MTAPTAGLVQVKVFVRFSVVLVRFMRVRTRLPWVFDEITAPVEKQFGLPPMPNPHLTDITPRFLKVA